MELLIIRDDLTAYPDPSIVEIKEFKELVKRKKLIEGDKRGDKKLRNIRELAYIYHLCSHKSPYAQFDESIREKEVIDAIFRDEEWKPDEVVLAAKKKYIELNKTHSLLILESAYEAVHKLIKYFKEVNLVGEESESAKDLISNLANVGKVVEGLDKLKEQVEKDMAGNNKNRKAVITNEFSE